MGDSKATHGHLLSSCVSACNRLMIYSSKLSVSNQRHAIEDLEIKELLIQLSTFVKSSPAITPEGGGI